MDKGGGDKSRLSVEKFFTHSAEKLRRGILYCFINFRYRKNLGIREGETRYFVEKVSSHIAEKFRSATILFSVSEIFRKRRTLWLMGGGYQDFPSKNFSLTVPKNFAWESFTASLIPGIEKI